MRKRRLALAVLVIAAGTFATLFGGASRTLFYLTLLILPMSALYTLYVYLRFRIYQSAECKVIVKGEKTPYHFILSDEDFLAYTDVSVNFLDDFSAAQDNGLSRSYHLIPGEKVDNHTEILCKYRGEYHIGVKSVTVTDFLGIVRICYPAPSVINMSVLPKITSVEKLSIAPLDDDAKLLRFSRANSSEQLDCELRRYTDGDNLRLVNWKVSAKKRELFVRQSSETQRGGITLIMDMTQTYEDEYSRVIVEDKVIETALTVADFLVRKHVPLTIIHEQGEVVRSCIDNPEQLKEFYGKCAALKFSGTHSPSAIFCSLPELSSGLVIFVVQTLSKRLCAVCNDIIRLGGDASVVLVGGDGEELSRVLDRRVNLRVVGLSAEIADVLGGANEH